MMSKYKKQVIVFLSGIIGLLLYWGGAEGYFLIAGQPTISEGVWFLNGYYPPVMAIVTAIGVALWAHFFWGKN